MVYSVDILGTESMSAQGQDPVFSAQGACACPNPAGGPYARTSQPVVGIYYNCCGIHTITGPTPTMDISSSIQRTEAGIPTISTTKITLTGKIVRGLSNPQYYYEPKGSGIKPVMSGINDLRALFSKGSCGDLDVYCINGGSFERVYSASGVKVLDITVNKSDDNWVYTADYTVNLEYFQPLNTGWYIKDYTDSWNLEPLEDYYVTDQIITTLQKSEWDNPNVKPVAGNASSPQPPGTQSGGQQAYGSIQWRNLNVPRFKLSHTVSAVGIPSGTGYCLNVQPDAAVYSPAELDAFLNAQRWVQQRASTIVSGQIPNPTNGLWSPLATGYLYNHVRSSKADIGGASYEITDSFLAMPTGISFLENYEIEISTDEKYIHTVTVQGEIEGLSVAKEQTIKASSMSPNPAMLDNTNNSSKHHLVTNLGANRSEDASAQSFNPPPYIADVSTNIPSTHAKLYNDRYENALSGWIYDVKPYLYRRACAVMNVADRSKGYVNPTNYTATTPPNNPVYSRHGLLNIIPISTTEGHNTRQGKISYNYQFNNKFMIISGALYENVSIEDTGPTDVIAEAFVLGRSLGPVLQNLGTKTSTKKQVTIEVGVVPPSTINGFFLNNKECPLWTGGSVYTTINGLVEGLKPFGDRPTAIFGNSATFGRNPATNAPGTVYVSLDNHSWDPSSGRYTRTVGWVYQQCNNSKFYLDN
jgi:hypothetical protein